jgi:hypothetical protein
MGAGKLSEDGMAEVAEAPDWQKARQLWIDLGREEWARATPQQLLEFMRRCDDAIGLSMANRMLDSMEAARLCWERDHDRQLHYFQDRVRELFAAQETK